MFLPTPVHIWPDYSIQRLMKLFSKNTNEKDFIEILAFIGFLSVSWMCFVDFFP